MISMASHMDAHSPERVPARMPARFPACDKSWQGEPPVMMSTGSTAAQSTVVTSPRFGTSGNRWARMRDGAASNSATQAGCASGKTSRTAISRPPTPAKSAPTRGFADIQITTLAGIVGRPVARRRAAS